MKLPAIKSLLLVAVLFTPGVQAQDAPSKIRQIEQKVLRERHQKAVQALIESARAVESGASGNNREALGKRMAWVTVVNGQIDGNKIAAADREEMTESAATLNDVAWKMITSPDTVARNPDIALKLAEIAIELGGENAGKWPDILDTRARALFMLGRKDEAIAGQEKAVAAAASPIEKAAFEATLAAYRRDELPELIRPGGKREAAAKAPLDPVVIKSKMDEIALLRKRITEAVKQSARVSTPEIDNLKEELRRRTAELAKLSDKKKPESQDDAVSGTAYIVGKLQGIIIPSVQFDDTTLEEAAAFLSKQSIEFDKSESDPARKGVKIGAQSAAKKPAPAAGGGALEPEVIRIKELRLRNVPLSEALRYICDATRCRYKVDESGVTLLSRDVPEEIFNRSFVVPPDFGSSLVPIQDLLTMCGVNFGEGAAATLSTPGTLMIRNTPIELDKIEKLIEADKEARSGRPVPEAVSPALTR